MTDVGQTLREQYETLLRRGMPEHPRLRQKRQLLRDSDFILKGCNGWCNSRINSADARDLITMHALRWFRQLDTTRVLIDGSERMARHALALLANHTNRSGQYDPDTLDAIIGATAHLDVGGGGVTEAERTDNGVQVAAAMLFEAMREGYLQHAAGCVGMYPGHKCKCGYDEFMERMPPTPLPDGRM